VLVGRESLYCIYYFVTFFLQRLNKLINPDMEEKRGDEMEMLRDPEKK